jgi:hypothetical protein
MPIRPLDIMKSQEVSQLKHLESHRSQQEQVHIGKNFQNLISAENARPNQTTKSENKEFLYDAKEKGQNSYSGSKGKKQEKKEENKKGSKEPGKVGGIDILI